MITSAVFGFLINEPFDDRNDITSNIYGGSNDAPDHGTNSLRSNNWFIQAVDRPGDVGRYAAVALDSQDRPHIGYLDMGARVPKYAHYDGESWTTMNVNHQGLGGAYISIDIDSTDNSVIAKYLDNRGKRQGSRSGGIVVQPHFPRFRIIHDYPDGER